MTNQNPFDITGLIELFTAGHKEIKDPVLDLPIREAAMYVVRPDVLKYDPGAIEWFLVRLNIYGLVYPEMPPDAGEVLVDKHGKVLERRANYAEGLLRLYGGFQWYLIPGEKTVGQRVEEALKDPNKRIRKGADFRQDEEGRLLRQKFDRFKTEEDARLFITKALHREARTVRVALERPRALASTVSLDALGGDPYSLPVDNRQDHTQQLATLTEETYALILRKAQEPNGPYEIVSVKPIPFDHREMQRQRHKYWWQPALGRRSESAVAPREDPDLLELLRCLDGEAGDKSPVPETVDEAKGLLARAQLPPQQARVGALLLDGHTLRETAAVLGIAYPTARVHKRDFLQRIRRHGGEAPVQPKLPVKAPYGTSWWRYDWTCGHNYPALLFHAHACEEHHARPRRKAMTYHMSEKKAPPVWSVGLEGSVKVQKLGKAEPRSVEVALSRKEKRNMYARQIMERLPKTRPNTFYRYVRVYRRYVLED